MIDFNKKMWTANTIIQGTQAAAGLMKAGVDVYNALDNYSRQKEIKLQNEGQKELDPILSKGVLNGDIRVDYDKNGNPKYSGLDDDTETGRAIQAWKTKYGDRIKNEMGGLKWGNSRRAQESFDQALLESYYGALGGAVEKRYSDTFNLFNSNYNDKIQEAIMSPDNSKFKNFMEESRDLMSPEIWQQKNAEGLEKINYGRIQETANSVAIKDGTKAAQDFINNQVQNKTQQGEMLIAAQKARADALKPLQEEQNGMWEIETANAIAPEQAQVSLNKLLDQQRAFEEADNEDSYYTYVQRLLSKGAKLGGDGMSETQLNDHNAAMIKLTMDRYESGQIGIDEAYAEMDSLDQTRWTIGEVEKRYKEMLEYKDPLTAKAYERAEQLCDEYGVDGRTRHDFMQGLIRTFTNNEIDRKDRLEYVEKFMTEQTAEYLNKALKPGVSWSESDQKKQNALSYEGKLDPYFTPVGKHGQQEMEVAGAGEIEKNVLKYSETVVKDTLKGTDLEYVSHEFEKNRENDKTGRVFHTVKDKDGNISKVIVNPQGKLEYADDRSSFDGKIKEGNESLVTSMRANLSDEQNKKIDELARAVNTAPHPRAQSSRMLDLRNALKGILGENYDKTDEGKAFEKYVVGRRM